MDKVTTLGDGVQREVELYDEGDSFKAQTFALSDVKRQFYAVVVFNDHDVIVEDRTDKPLVDAPMINGGIPREQIVLAYAGETLPEQRAK